VRSEKIFSYINLQATPIANIISYLRDSRRTIVGQRTGSTYVHCR
jgi:hypothetical protein